MSSGADGTIGTSEIVTAYGKFANADETNISLLVSGSGNLTTAAYLISLAESRKDCMVFLSPPKSTVVNNAGGEATGIVAYRDTLASSSYASMDSGYKYQYDKYNDVYRFIPLNGDIAGLCARTDSDRDPWFSPGGLSRGQIKNVIKLSFNPTKADRDTLYVKGINPVVTFAGEGTVLFGDKTLLNKPSVFDRINVRRLFIVLEKSIAVAARSSLFEFNDSFTRAQFVGIVEPFLRTIQGRRGITDYRVICNETNNTPDIIDNNQFVGDIYIKPARSVNFIQLNFVAVRTGVAFEEIVGRI
jgi:phage tail sheath protein FI